MPDFLPMWRGKFASSCNHAIEKRKHFKTLRYLSLALSTEAKKFKTVLRKTLHRYKYKHKILPCSELPKGKPTRIDAERNPARSSLRNQN